jgi:NADH-quinone oxidoreductase subunit J
VSGEYLAFLALALVAIIGGVLMLNLTKVVHMVIALVFTFISIAGLYVLLSAEFVAVVQVLIYSGAITIMMLFGIMLTRHQEEEGEKTTTGGFWRKALTAIAVFAFGIAVYLGVYQLDFGEEGARLHENNTEQIGMALYSHYTIPFEIASVILLVALVGAIILAKKDDEGAKKP